MLGAHQEYLACWTDRSIFDYPLRRDVVYQASPERTHSLSAAQDSVSGRIDHKLGCLTRCEGVDVVIHGGRANDTTGGNCRRNLGPFCRLSYFVGTEADRRLSVKWHDHSS